MSNMLETFLTHVYGHLNKKYSNDTLPKNVIINLKRIQKIDKIKKISIVITTRNRLESLKKYALDSLMKLKFDKEKYEIIIVDNGSDFETYNYLKKLRNKKIHNLLVLKEEREGASYGRNKGIKYSKGDVVAFVDDDCYVDENWLFRLFNFYNSTDYLFGRGYIYEEKLKKIMNPYKKDENEEAFFSGNLSFKKEVFNLVSFNENFLYGSEDMDLISQIWTFWPESNYFVDKEPIKHYSAESFYRDKGNISLNRKGIKMDKKMNGLWNVNRSILKRNLKVNSTFFSLSYLIKELLFFPLELSFINFNLVRLIKTKLIIYRQLKKIKSFSK